MSLTLSNRIYLQYAPADPEQLMRLQTALSDAGVKGKLVNRRALHLTLIHFGVAEQVARDLEQRHQTSQDEFAQSLPKLLEALQQIAAPPTLPLAVKSIDRFGPSGGVIALQLVTSAELIALHQSAYTTVTDWFTQLGLNHQQATTFMRSNHNLQHAHSLNPHISLFKRAGDGPLPKIALPDEIELEKMQLIY
jgi:hypothetical protein